MKGQIDTGDVIIGLVVMQIEVSLTVCEVTLGGHTLAPNDWFPNYVATYLERDVRQLLSVHDLSQFHRFVRMCAARSGQLLNLATLGADCGISAVTAGKWLSVLKSGSTFAPDWPQAARKWAGLAGAQALAPMIVYGGAGRYARQECEVVGWREFALGMTA